MHSNSFFLPWLFNEVIGELPSCFMNLLLKSFLVCISESKDGLCWGAKTNSTLSRCITCQIVWGQQSHAEICNTYRSYKRTFEIRFYVIVTQQRATVDQCARKLGNLSLQTEWSWVNCKLITSSHQNIEAGSCVVWVPCW